MVSEKCKRVLEASSNGEDLNEFEHVVISKKQMQDNFFEGATDYMSMRTSTRAGRHGRLPSLGGS